MTDIVSNKNGFFRAAIITILCVLASLALNYVSLPVSVLDLSGNHFFKFFGGQFHLGILGLNPLILGFFFVEMLSLFLVPFCGWRCEGRSGRNKLNRAGLVVCVVITLVSAFSMGRTIAGTDFGGIRSSVVIVAAFLSAGLFIRMGLIAIISRFGIGDGFSLLFFAHLMELLIGSLLRYVPRLKSIVWMIHGYEDRILQVVILIMSATILGWITYRTFRRSFFLAETNDRSLQVESPSVPQSISLVQFALSLFYLPAVFGFGSMPESWSLLGVVPPQAISKSLLNVLAIPFLLAFSYLGFVLLSRGETIEQASEGRVTVESAVVDRLHLNRSLLLALLFGVALFAQDNPLIRLKFQMSFLVSIGFLLHATAVCMDLWHCRTFVTQHGLGTRAFVFDNCHLAGIAKALLEQNDIPFRFDGFYFRRLHFLFLPIAKMSLYVREEDLSRVNDLLSLDSIMAV